MHDEKKFEEIFIVVKRKSNLVNIMEMEMLLSNFPCEIEIYLVLGVAK